jgi:hypothetical protein
MELGGLLSEARSLEFESGLVVQISDVSPEGNETALPSAEAPGKAAQSALTAGPLAHEQATIHAVADALRSRGSAPAGDVGDQIPRGSPCDNEQTERVEGPAHRRDLALLNKATLTKIPDLELSQRERRNRQTGHIRHHALDPDCFRCRLQKQRAGNPRGTRRALPHLLAADFCFYLPTWLFDPGRRGPHAGFLCDDTGR